MPNDSTAVHPFVESVQQHWATKAWASHRLLLAVSGGPDSVAVLRAMRQLVSNCDIVGTEIHVAHFNHRWRGEVSDANEHFVAELCEQLDLPFHLQSSTDPKKKEEFARLERYDFLRHTAGRLDARYVVFGHNANDHAETILHRVIRGTAIRGLAGIPWERPLGDSLIYRPILWALREDVLGYLHDIQQAYCIDDSNQDIGYMRNRIRHELLPMLADRYNPGVLQSLLRLGEVARELNAYMDEQIQAELPGCIVREDVNLVELDRDRLLELPLHLRKQVLVAIWRRQGWPEQSMGFDQWNQIIQAMDSRAKVSLRGNIRITSQGNTIRLTQFGS